LEVENIIIYTSRGLHVEFMGDEWKKGCGMNLGKFCYPQIVVE
jgi:hypothetical protein